MTEEVTPPADLPLLTYDQLIALASQRRYRRVDMPPLGSLRVRSLLANEIVECDRFQFDDKGTFIPGKEQYMRAKYLTLAIVKADNTPMFTEADVPAIAKWPEPLMAAAYQEAREANKPGFLPMFADPA